MATANKNPQAAKAAASKSVAATAGQPAPGMRQMLQVIAKRDGFRRAGREWHGTSHVPLDELTRAQYEQLTTEPMLVTYLDEPASAPDSEVADPAPDA